MRRAAGLFQIVLLLAGCATAPSVIPKNEYGLEVVRTPRLYRALVREDPTTVLVPVTRLSPGIRLDVRYATDENFMKRQLYPEPEAWLRCEAAVALAAVQRDLEARGFGLVVFDAYRPYSVTEMMWEGFENPDYVADPAKGSRHNRGAAVDVSLIDLRTGEELPMPTGYDDFTERAWQHFAGLPTDALRNRAILREVMERHGFVPLASEWWHFDFGGWEKFDLLDIPHASLDPMPAECAI